MSFPYDATLSALTPPTLPAGTTFNLGTWATATVGGSVVLQPSSGDGNVGFVLGTADDQAGNVKFTLDVTFTAVNGFSDSYGGRIEIQLPNTAASKLYTLGFLHGRGFASKLRFTDGAGGQTDISSAVAWAASKAYRMTLAKNTASGTTTVTATLRNLTDGTYMAADGTWSTTSGTCLSIADSSGNQVTGAAAAKVYAYDELHQHTYYFPGYTFAAQNAITPPTTSVAVSPSSFPLGVLTDFTLTGTATSWTSATVPTVSGTAGSALDNFTVTGQVITGRCNPGSATGTLTFGTTTDSATTTATATSPTIIGHIAFLGDSLTDGYAGTGAGTTSATRLATVAAGMGPQWAIYQCGVSGQTVQSMTAELSTTVAAAYDGSKAHNLLVIQGGHNNIINQYVTAATTQGYIATLIAAAVAAGWTVIWATELPAGVNAALATDFNPKREAINAWIRANWRSLGISAVSDIGADSVIGLGGASNNSTYYAGDHVHCLDPAYARWGLCDLATIRAWLGDLVGGDGSAGAVVYQNVTVRISRGR